MKRIERALAFALMVSLVLAAGCSAAKVKEPGSKREARKESKEKESMPGGNEQAKPTESTTGTPAKPIGTAPGLVNAKPLEGELVNPVKREDDIGIYRELQAKLKFTPLYPGYMPSGFKVADRDAVFQAVNNGVNGFSIRYQSASSGGITLMEGNVFNPAPGKETEQIKIRNGTAYLESIDDDRYGVFFVWNGTRYGLASDGMSKEEVRKIATALISLDELK
ncbi:MAG: DUF4367 domain-containing protein [Actinobacteria bacterium]|nr:DUF4367 domain-containing protein [Actinomycetota bacterium]